MSNIQRLTVSSFIAIATLVAFSLPAKAADEICAFHSDAAYFATTSAAPETLFFEWLRSDGEVLDFMWLHGPSSTPWFSFASSPGTVVSNTYPGDYHLRVDLGITTSRYESYRYSILGFLEPRIGYPDATFAGIYEGTSSAWFVAYGTVNCSAI